MSKKNRKIISISVMLVLIIVSALILSILWRKQEQSSPEENDSGMVTEEPEQDDSIAGEEDSDEDDGIELPPDDVTDQFLPVEDYGSDEQDTADHADQNDQTDSELPGNGGDGQTETGLEEGDLPEDESFH